MTRLFILPLLTIPTSHSSTHLRLAYLQRMEVPSACERQLVPMFISNQYREIEIPQKSQGVLAVDEPT